MTKNPDIRPYFEDEIISSVARQQLDNSSETLNASRPSERPPVRGENVKPFRLGGIIGCKYKTSSWHF